MFRPHPHHAARRSVTPRPRPARRRLDHKINYTLCLGLTVIIIGSVLAPGCRPYTLQGKVISGPASMISFVKASDPNLDEFGIAGATLDLILEPDKLSKKPAGTTISDRMGNFQLPVSQPGAGVLVYEARLVCRLKGHAPAVHTFRLPASQKHALIMLAPGRNVYMPPKSDILDETLQMSKPYLNE